MTAKASALAVAFASLCAVLAGATFDGAPTQRVTLRTDDGLTLSAQWYEPSSQPAPAVILVHMLNRSRRDWEAFAHRLAGEGIGALAIDLRGHGESQRFVSPSATDTGYASMVHDVKAARRYLASRADVQQSRVGIAGASLGANVAALAAAADGSLDERRAAFSVARLQRAAHRAGHEVNRQPSRDSRGRE